MIRLLLILEEIITLIQMIVKFPLKLVCKIKKEHDWRCHSGGFLFDYKYPFTCKRCGCRCKGDLDELNKKGFNGIARIK